MKLHELKILNIASIEQATIDFDASPLTDSNVILITGNTGAGKSTILDAICLALYGTTPRLKNTKMDGKWRESDADEMDVTDTMQLMRKNTQEAFVSLTFLGNDGNEYEAQWHVQRQRKNLSRTWTLKNLTHPEASPAAGNGGLGAKDKPIREAMMQAIGLDFEQFCRTTMLAQGEFTRFLKCSNTEKASILEKITNTEEYAKIGRGIFMHTAQQKQQMEAADPAKQEQAMGEEERAALDASIAAYDERLKELEKTLDSLRRQHAWLTEDKRLTEGEIKAQQSWNQAQQERQSERYQQISRDLSEWDMTNDARVVLDYIRRTEPKVLQKAQDIEKHTALIAQKKKERDELLPQLMQSKAALDKAQTEYERLNLAVDTLAQKLRESLQPGRRCPICGQAIKSTGQVPHESELQAIVSKARLERDKAKETYEALFNKQISLSNWIKQAEPALEKEQRDLEQLHQDLQKTQESYAAFRQSHPDMTELRLDELMHMAPSITRMRSDKQRIDAAMSAAGGALRGIKTQISTHQAEKPEIAPDATIEFLGATIKEQETVLRQLNTENGANREKQKADNIRREKLSALAKTYARIEEDYRKWERLNKMIGDAKGQKFKLIAQGYILSNLIKAANVHMDKLSDRYVLHSVPGQDLIILVEDRYQGGVLRPASTISGGESFLVSLALALALSEIGQSLKVEMLFIDEGFGTLSGEPLLKAIETLKTLHESNNRRVCAISHREEVKESIPVQIQVIQHPQSSASSVEIVES